MDPDARAMLRQVLDGKWEVIDHINTSNFGHVFEGRRLPSVIHAPSRCCGPGAFTTRLPWTTSRSRAICLNCWTACSNIIDIFDRGHHSLALAVQGPGGGQPITLQIPYIVLELADACLADLISWRHELPWSDRLALFREVVRGLHQMHQHQVVNRDAKSNNVLVLGGPRKRIDAKLADLGRSSNTRTPNRVHVKDYDFMRGDPVFSAPELIWGLGDAQPETARLADIYLLGSVLFEFGAGVGLTGLIVPEAEKVSLSVAALSDADRQREYDANVPQLRQALEVAYTQFETELPDPIRAQGMDLLRLLTHLEPTAREPKTMSGRRLTLDWDLQWLLRKVDNLLRMLAVEKRQQAALQRKRARRTRRTTPSGTGKTP